MKKIAGNIVIVLGLVLIFLSPFLRFYTVPRVEKAPTDVQSRVVSVGEARIFTVQALEVQGPVDVQNIEEYRGDVEASTDDVAVVNYRSHLVRLDTGDDVQYDDQVYVFDRKTGFAVNCCGERPEGREGILLKFPFGTEQTTYPFWDDTAREAYPARFQREETIDGLPVYVFEVASPKKDIDDLDLPGSLVGREGVVAADQFYEGVTTIWIDPVTGAVVKGARHVEQWAEADGERLLDLVELDAQYSDETVADRAAEIRDSVSQLRLVKVTLPLFSPIVGVLLLIAGVLLLRARAATESPHSSATDRGDRKGARAEKKAEIEAASTQKDGASPRAEKAGKTTDTP
jgi:uncharacterized membrane protein